MFVSVVVATFNRKEKLAFTLEAFRGQTYPAHQLEVIVVDNGSSDGTVELLEKLTQEWPNLRYGVQFKRGPAAARNLGVQQAKGEIVAFTDDDCVPPPDWLERLVDGYRRYPEVVGVGGYLEAAGDVIASNVFARYERYIAREVFNVGDREVVGGLDCPAWGTNNMSYLRRVLEEVGGFDESFLRAAGEDTDLKKRICERGYKLLFTPVGITHLHAYTLAAFVKQAQNRGFGSAHFHRKHGSPVGLRGTLLHLGILLRAFTADIASPKRKDFAVLGLIEGVCGCYGQYLYLRSTARGLK